MCIRDSLNCGHCGPGIHGLAGCLLDLCVRLYPERADGSGKCLGGAGPGGPAPHRSSHGLVIDPWGALGSGRASGRWRPGSVGCPQRGRPWEPVCTFRPAGAVPFLAHHHGGRTDLAAVSYTHLRAHETKANLVCRLLLEKKKKQQKKDKNKKKKKKKKKKQQTKRKKK